MQRAINYLRGSVRLEVVGPYPERYFNICSARGIRFWGVERLDETSLRLTVSKVQARRAIALGARCLCDVTAVQERGAPSRARQLARRYGMLAGLALSLAAVLVLSRFVLVIHITGNEAVPTETIRAELARIGLDVGSYGPALEPRELSNRALMDLEELSFLSVNLKGIRAEVVVREKAPVPELEPTEGEADLVAAKAGTVEEIIALAGTALVEPGAEVEPGDALISGRVTLTRRDDPSVVIDSYGVRAKGFVWAEVEERLSAAFPLTASWKVYTGETQTRWELSFFSQRFQISKKTFQPFAEYDKIEEQWALSLGEGLELPIALHRVTARAYEGNAVALNADQAEALLRETLERRLARSLGEYDAVLARDWTVERRDGALSVTLTARCREQIAVTGEE